MSLIDYEIDERFLQSTTLSFKVPASDLKVLHLVEDAKLELDYGDYFYITDVIKQREDEVADYEVLAETRWMKLADLKRPGNFTLSGVTAKQGLDAILEGTGWVSYQVSSDPTLRSLDATDATVLDLIWTWAKICILEVSFDVAPRQVNFVTQVGATKPLSFRYGRNLTAVKRTSKAPTCTRMYVFGREGVGITGLTSGGVPYIEDYTYYTDQGMSLLEAQTNYRKDQIYSDESFLDDNSLYQAALARLTLLSHPSVMYECSVVDLSSLTGSPDYDFRCGDTVRVYDGELGIDIAARVTRKVTRPYEPDKNKIELSFGSVLLPDPHITTTRPSTSGNWELFQSRNTGTLKKVRQFATILHRLHLNTTAEAQWVVGFKLYGVATGTGTLTFTMTDDDLVTNFWNPIEVDVVSGETFEINFTYGEQLIAEGNHTLAVRSISSGAGVGANILPGDTAFWVLAQGTTREEITLPNSVRFDYIDWTSSPHVQNWQVPPGVSEILVEAVGGSGSNTTNGGKGGRVACKFAVVEGMIFDIYVGGHSIGAGSNPIGGWPDGGNGATVSSSIQSGGGSSTQMRASGGLQPNSWIIAGAGGGAGDNDFIGNKLAPGGDGGFYDGDDGQIVTGGVGTSSSNGAHDDVPGGAWGGGGNPGEQGDIDGPGYGGDAGACGNFFAWPGGGGGGGFHGGGGAAGDPSIPGFFGGGGGGNGTVASNAYDLEFDDGYNPPGTHGYLIISWAAPDTTV